MSANAPASVAEAIRRHRDAYVLEHRPPEAVHKLLNLLPLCRTSALGGHLLRCSDCGHEQPRYNSCGNRHCPACQVKAREKWLSQQEAALLELPYFHVVFTLTGELQSLILRNKAAGYTLLFKSAAATLLKFGRDPRHGLNGQLGFTAVLHTWNQRLGPHAHLHVLVPAGALSEDKSRFVRAADRRWLFPVKALSVVFRAMFLKRLKAAHKRTPFAGVDDANAFADQLDTLHEKPWVVYAKRPFGGPAQVLSYLGRYTHRVGISNTRIKHVDDQHVTFGCRDPKNPAKKIPVTLEGPEFLRRFFLHVLPKGFTRIRHYGFLGNAVRQQNLPRIREHIGQSKPEPSAETPLERIARVFKIDVCACPQCKTGTLNVVCELRPRPGQDPPE